MPSIWVITESADFDVYIVQAESLAEALDLIRKRGIDLTENDIYEEFKLDFNKSKVWCAYTRN